MKRAKQTKAMIFIWITKACMEAATSIDFVRETAKVRINEKTMQKAKKIQKPPYWSKF
jgi:hypothetical protein